MEYKWIHVAALNYHLFVVPMHVVVSIFAEQGMHVWLQAVYSNAFTCQEMFLECLCHGTGMCNSEASVNS